MTDVIEFPERATKLKQAADFLLNLFVVVERPGQRKGWYLVGEVPSDKYPKWLRDILASQAAECGDTAEARFMATSAATQALECLATHDYKTVQDALVDVRFINYTVDQQDALKWLTYEPNRKIADLAWQSDGQKVYGWSSFEGLLWTAVAEWYKDIADDIINGIMENWEQQ